MTPTCLLTKKTLDAFDGKPIEILLVPGKHGPFFHVSLIQFGDDPKVAKDCYKKNAQFSRTDLIKKFIDNVDTSKILDRKKLDLFLKINEEKIEMDAIFSLLGPLQKYFDYKLHREIKKKFLKTSRERWVGLTKPNSFLEANRLYALSHLEKGKYKNKPKYLYEIHLDVHDDIPNLVPVAQFGKVKDGTSFQFKLNNHAIECVCKVKSLDEFPASET